MRRPLWIAAALLAAGAAPAMERRSESLTLHAPALDVFVFNTPYNDYFGDSKISGIELVHHHRRLATNGDLRLNPTPEQWDPVPEIVERRAHGTGVAVQLRYARERFEYTVIVEPAGPRAFTITVELAAPLPAALAGRAGFNLEFLPSAYFGHGYFMDDTPGLFPLHPTSLKEIPGVQAPEPLARGRRLVLAPDAAERRLDIASESGELVLYDGRGRAQNGWFLVREVLPAGRAGTVLRWRVEAGHAGNDLRPPVIAHNQLGHPPQAPKRAVIELDARARPARRARVLRVHPDGREETARTLRPADLGRWLRHRYVALDFGDLREPGLYRIEYAGARSAPFPIAPDAWTRAWHPTLDVYLPVQMDHMRVEEGYRVWHGASHLDDARQAPVGHRHFDLYAQGPTTETRYAPGEHVPGLNVGGWYDAGDYDIRTQTQYDVVNTLVELWERYAPARDTTHVDWTARRVELHRADGTPDVLQQIRHGVLALVAQYRAFGRAVPGIVAPTLEQYTHLGDGASKTDNFVYDPALGELERRDGKSGLPDDRWVFTGHSSALNYGAAAALAAAARVLPPLDPALAAEALDHARRAWAEEDARPAPARFTSGNTTGGPLELERFKAAVELWLSTAEAAYGEAAVQALDALEPFFEAALPWLLKAAPRFDEATRARLRRRAADWLRTARAEEAANPFGVPIRRGGWAGNGFVLRRALAHDAVWRLFPDLGEREAAARGLDYLLGTHPDHALSFVSAVGARSKRVAYGMNRADFSFIPGGIVPGVLIIEPDLPENKEDWPFLWGENEYVVNLAPAYILLVHAVQDALAAP